MGNSETKATSMTTALMAGPGEQWKGGGNKATTMFTKKGRVALRGGLYKRGLHGGRGEGCKGGIVGRGRSVAELARQWEGSAPCSRGEANPEADHLGGKYPGGEPERYQYALELRSRKHVATGESGRKPGWPSPRTQASRHDMNSGWTCVC